VNPETLLETIHAGWDLKRPQCYSVEIPPGCGASWFARQLSDADRIAIECPEAADIDVCRLDGAAIQNEWKFSRTLMREWGAAVLVDSSSPVYKMLLEDHDAQGLLSYVVRLLRKHKRLPVLVIDRFHRLAWNLEAIFAQMRTIEQDGLMCTVALLPISQMELKRRWQDTGRFFANSDYGDNHEQRYMGALSPDYARCMAAEYRLGDMLEEIIAEVEKHLGRRSCDYVRGFEAWHRANNEFGGEDTDAAKERFLGELKTVTQWGYDRLFRWADAPRSTRTTQLIASVYRGELTADEFKTRAGKHWHDIFIAPDGKELSSTGIGQAAEEFLTRIPAEQPGETESRIGMISRGLLYRGRPVTSKAIHGWLSQFSAENRHAWLGVLEKLRQDYFYSSSRMERKLYRVYHEMRRHLMNIEPFSTMRWESIATKRLRIVEVCGLHKSEGRLLHEFCLVNRIPRVDSCRHLEDALDEAYSRPTTPLVIVAADDFVGSGNSVGRILKAALKSVGALHGGKWPTNALFYYLAAVGFAKGKRNIENLGGQRIHVVLGNLLDDSDRVFSSTSAILSDPSIRQALKTECEMIGRELRPQEPLGYGAGQGLVTLHYDVPNNSLPVLYEGGTFRGTTWTPLFGRPDRRRN
jgi:hypothetical protein